MGCEFYRVFRIDCLSNGAEICCIDYLLLHIGNLNANMYAFNNTKWVNKLDEAKPYTIYI